MDIIDHKMVFIKQKAILTLEEAGEKRHHTDRGQKGGVQRIVVRNKETEKSR